MKTKAQKVAGAVLTKIATEMQEQFAKDRAMAAERLYNAFADAINEQRPSVETVVYVLRQVEHTVITEQRKKVFDPGREVADIKSPPPEPSPSKPPVAAPVAVL